MTGREAGSSASLRIDKFGWLGGGEVFASKQSYGGFEGGGPVLDGGVGVGSGGFDVEGEGEAFVDAGKVDEGRTEDALEGGLGKVESGGSTDEAVGELALEMDGGEEGAVAGEEVDVAPEAMGVVGGGKVEFEAEAGDLFGGEGPGVAFGGEDGRTGSVEGAECLHQLGVLLGLGNLVEVVGVFAEVYEVGGGCGVMPGNDEGGVFGGAFGGPVGEHGLLILVERLA